MTDAPDSGRALRRSLWSFYHAMRRLPVQDSCTRVALLYALLDAPRANGSGFSVSQLAAHVDRPDHIVRYHLHALQREGAIRLSGKNGRAELFVVADDMRHSLSSCLAEAGRAIPE